MNVLKSAIPHHAFPVPHSGRSLASLGAARCVSYALLDQPTGTGDGYARISLIVGANGYWYSTFAWCFTHVLLIIHSTIARLLSLTSSGDGHRRIFLYPIHIVDSIIFTPTCPGGTHW